MLQESAMFINDFLAFARLAPPSPSGREAGEQGHERYSFGVITAEGVAVPVMPARG